MLLSLFLFDLTKITDSVERIVVVFLSNDFEEESI